MESVATEVCPVRIALVGADEPRCATLGDERLADTG
jgi:hypothetical protein